MKYKKRYLLLAVAAFLVAVYFYGKPVIVPTRDRDGTDQVSMNCDYSVGQPTAMGTGWYNYRTGETDWLKDSPKDYRDYIPQQGPVQAIYGICLLKGLTPAEACVKTLDIYIEEFDKSQKPGKQKIQRVN